MKKLMLGLMMAIAATAFAAQSVTINKVETANPWDGAKGTITVEYSLAGLDPKLEYKVAFDVTAKNETKGVTNDLAKLTEVLQGVMTIDTAALFGKEIVDKDAEISISLIKFIKKVPAGQLWENGPVWADANLGSSEVDGHPEYGALYKFLKAWEVVKRHLGQEWRVPSKDDFDKLVDTSYCTRTWDDTRKGWTFTGLGDYSSNSIFLSAAGCDFGEGRKFAGDNGNYWSSTTRDSEFASYLDFDVSNAFLYFRDQTCGMSVRAVRDAAEGVVIVGEDVVAIAEAEFWLGPGCESCPWTVGEGVSAYIKGVTLLVEGVGAVGAMPWTEFAAGINELVKQKGVTGLEGIVATLPALTMVNGLTLKELNGLAVGAVKADGFSAIAVDPATKEATLSVVICKAKSLEAEWKPVVTNDVPVAADTPAGFFIVAPQVPSEVVPHSPAPILK